MRDDELKATFGTRWVRDLDVPPGHWKRQLPGKHLKLAVRGDLDGLSKLLAGHPDWLDRRGSHGRTFLFEAVRRGHTELVGWLLERGADITLTGCYNSESIVQLSPLVAAQYYNRPQIIEMLAERGAKHDIFRAAFCGESPRVEEELAENPSLVNAEDPHDNIYFTPLISFAVAGNQPSIVDYLLDRDAAVEKYSFQLLFLGAHLADKHMVNLLLKHGADPSAADATLWMATDDMETINMLVAAGLSANQRPYHGLHPLAYACRGDKRKNVAKVARLIELGADLNAQTEDGRTALHYAARVDNIDVVRLLLDAGANKHIANAAGELPLDIAKRHGHEHTAKQLSA